MAPCTPRAGTRRSDGNLLALDARHGRELWRFQTGAAISSSPIMYKAGGICGCRWAPQ
ncbi:hypothetical protein ACQP2E_20745 [Actinoplanes sp. CA-015351]|uniref:hypothetical protein n=1 Tax=Actinoplanes sp. CA-015351 TaxID=3239897 RepID=UPI003D9764C7